MSTRVLCKCVTRHSPVPRAFQVHHAIPRGWGGQDVAANRVTICGTTHDNVHHALDEAVRLAYGAGGDGTLSTAQVEQLRKPYNAYTAWLIRRAIVGVRYRIPRVYTSVGLPEGDERHAANDSE